MAEQDPSMLFFPEGEALKEQIGQRRRRGTVFRLVFISATITAIVVLIALLLNILDQAFGLVAVQNEVDPSRIVITTREEQMLSVVNTISSEDDNRLADGIRDFDGGIGFFGYAYYTNNTDTLRAVTIDGVAPSAETAESGEYLLSRPLYLYTTADLLEEKPQVAAFLNYYLAHAEQVAADVGYFPATAQTMAAMRATLDGIGVALPAPGDVSGSVALAGSSTVFPISQQMAAEFQAAGFAGDVSVESSGSTAGFRAFCVDGAADIANASRPIAPGEREACRRNGREPIELRIATDAVAVVVNREADDYVDNLTREQLIDVFTETQFWDLVNPAWPAEPIVRFIPGADSGTLDFFTEVVFDEELADLEKDELVAVLAAGITTGRGRVLEREQRFYADRLVFEEQDRWDTACASDDPPAACGEPARTQESVYELVVAEVIKPRVQRSYSLRDTLFSRDRVLADAATAFPDAEVEFRSWLTPRFLMAPQSDEPDIAGVRTAILGTLWVILITMTFSFPVGVGAAIYLEEYADQSNFFNRIVQTNINNLAGVPSIIYGMLGLAVFVRVMEPITSGAIFGTETENGRTILSAGLTLGLLILPLIIINAQEAIRAVPRGIRMASYGLGATQWQTIWNHVLPNALPGILTGVILAMARAVGETAPLVVVGASTFITFDPSGPFSKFTVLPIQIYQWTSRPQDEFRNIAAAAILVLLVLMLSLNASAVLLRNRFAKQM